MEEKNNDYKRNRRRVLYVIIMIAFTTLAAIVGTYAWFVGQEIVTVDSFEVKISAPDDLKISLNGVEWEESIEINEYTVKGTSSVSHNAYENNKNTWITNNEKLRPYSSNGEDAGDQSGRLKLFTKSSVTATKGGFRFKAEQIDNSNEEWPGYIAFDLFIKNGSKSNYKTAYNADENDSIYLTRDSSVIATPLADNSNPDLGIDNSIRVAFKPIGRVKSDTSPVSSITGIDCTTTATQTGLCTVQNTTIWEPNNVDHNSSLIAEYEERCKVRAGLESYVTQSNPLYATDYIYYECEKMVNGEDIDTYVVNNSIASNQKIDIYDGHNYYYTNNLSNIDTFTDTTKSLNGEFRKALFGLAANSITKVRIYIYLEGQDLDNSSLASNGKTVKINFGLTKDAFSTETSTTTPTLADYTWTEIKMLSDELVAGTLTYSDMVSKYGITIGQTKTATINGEKHKFRLVGTLHDMDAEGHYIGMTFEQTDLMNSAQKMKNSMSSGDSWGNSNLKTTINSWTIESELNSVITEAKKSTVTSVSNGAQTYVTSKLWIMSETEISNAQTNTKSGTAEGTPYAYYTSQSYSYQSRVKRQGGAKVEYWLRSATNYASSTSTFAAHQGYNIGSGAASQSRGVAVCFCI